ncbi:hypothetical protein CC99x_004100 [Candidatus Berkiella cookevillensis]|uniref:PAP2 superfamily protein n=1 Tax=Candidatus Berkiella cookevillensis TaxID=437022 RepID=A0A0Q9YCH1_9GAMM|nr:hypothetical protein [Candidatus Berkiella cookevillensis]MCS5708082.1 hypothetical protein [Candidatus Berkiella cookevillensis]
MHATKIIAEIGLIFSQPVTLVIAFLLGTFFLNTKAFSKAFMLMLFTMIYNLYLKSIWQIPLEPPLEGWAFPSGHMHAAWVFWGWLVCHYKKWSLFATFLVAMSLATFGMIDHGYHNIIDVLGAIGFGSLSLLIFYGLNRTVVFKENMFVASVLISGLGLLFLCMMPASVQTKLHIWQAQGGLLGLSLGWLYYNPSHTSLKLYHKVIMLLSCVAGMAGLHFALLHPPTQFNAQLFTAIKTFLLAVWILLSQRLFTHIFCRYFKC